VPVPQLIVAAQSERQRRAARHDADDSPRFVVHLDHAADHGRIGAVSTSPQAVAQNRDSRHVVEILGWDERPAKGRGESQHGHQRRRHARSPDAFGVVAAAQRE
jgi:hypothetical protein